MKRTLAILLTSIGALWAQSAPVIVPNGVVNSADYSRVAAPGALLTIFGRDLSPRLDAAASMPMPTTLQGVTVEVIDGGRTVLAPLYFVSPGQVNAMLPYDVGASIQVRVRTAAGVSNADTLAISARAPRLFLAEAGRALATHNRDFSVLTRDKPAKPGEMVVLLVNSMGAVEPGLAAGAGAGSGTPGDPLNVVSEPVTVTIDGRPARVDYAGLMPYLAGLYQINVRMPYYDVAGDLAVTVNTASSTSQGDVSVPAEPNGFYWVINGGKFVSGQTLNGVSGAGSAIAFAHDDALWGTTGLGGWTKEISHGPAFSATAGLALTLKNGNTIVYDNNGIETGTQGTYYDNSRGGSDSDKPGLMTYFSMSNFTNAIFAGYFRLTERATFNQMIGYFDGNGNSKLPFDPANVYNGYRMNIWSNGAGNTPRGTSLFVGDVFSSDRAPGVFTFADTGVTRTFSDGAKDPIFRLVYTLNAPVTLEPGEYWFSHDVAVPALTVQGASQPGTAATERVRPANSPGARRVRPDSVTRFER